MQTEEFDQNVIDDIIEGVTTTTVQPATNEESEGIENVLNQEESFIIPEDEVSKIEQILINNSFEEDIKDFDTYLLIVSDERS